jgi:hypothetical protein
MRRYLSDKSTVLGLVTILLVAPFFVFHDLPLYDLPDHIARQHILFGDGAAGADQYYAADWRLVPNLAMEGFVFLFHRLTGVEGAVRLFLACTAAQLFWGTLAVSRALHGKISRLGVLAALFVYNGPFLFGFVNLSFGLGMALWVFALWLIGRERIWALPVFAALSSLILFAHLFAFAVYALLILAYEAAFLLQARRQKRKTLSPALLPLLHLLVPLAIYFGLMPREVAAGEFYYTSVLLKFSELRGAVGFYNPSFDALSLLALVLGSFAVIHRIAIDRDLVLPLAALVLVYALLPHQFGESTFVDYRIPAAAALLLAGALDWRPGAAPRRRTVEAFILALFLLRWGVTMAQWQSWQADYAEYRAAFAQLPEGAKLLPLSPNADVIDPEEHPPLAHMAALAVTLRGVLIPSLFAELDYQILVYREPYRALATQYPTAALAPQFDYVLLIRPDEISNPPPYDEIARGRSFVLGRLTH